MSSFDTRFPQRGSQGRSTQGSSQTFGRRSSLPLEAKYALKPMYDSKELVTMFIWNPNYFISRMNNFAGEISGFKEYKESGNLVTTTSHEKNNRFSN